MGNIKSLPIIIMHLITPKSKKHYNILSVRYRVVIFRGKNCQGLNPQKTQNNLTASQAANATEKLSEVESDLLFSLGNLILKLAPRFPLTNSVSGLKRITKSYNPFQLKFFKGQR